jgi:hypothetical protein
MSHNCCTHGDLVVETRSLVEAHSVRSSYWIREVGRDDTLRGGPFETLPQACRAADALARDSGTRVWRKVSGLLADDEFVLQLMEPGA